jgi:hypothetical protein
MSKFKVGDKIVIVKITKNCRSDLKVGDTAIIDDLFFNKIEKVNLSASMLCDKNIKSCYHALENIELVKPKWSIYNNTLPWSELSDKQKGKLLLGDHKGIKFTIDNVALTRVGFIADNSVYKAQYIEPVKPEPTMAELFLIDWQDCLCVGGKQEQKMIAKGWTKPC